MTTTKAIVAKISKTGKTMLVGVKMNKYAIGFQFGWVANPDGLVKGDVIEDFDMPVGTVGCKDEEGNALLHEDGTAVVRFTFA